MPRKQSEQPVTNKTYILTCANGTIRKVTVPSTWKLTFGPTVPYAPKEGYRTDRGYSLRFYEGAKENLRAVFSDVVAFRDDSIGILERKTEVQKKVIKKQTPQGAKDVVVEARVTEWSNPDEVDQDHPEQRNEFIAQLQAMPDPEF